MSTKTVLARIKALQKAEDSFIDSTLAELFGELPKWIPQPSVDRARRIVQKLKNDGFSIELIVRFVHETERDSLTYPGLVRDPQAFTQSMCELAHLRYALALEQDEALTVLSGEQAALGQKFKAGRKPGTGGPVRKAIAHLLTKDPSATNPALWNAILAKPPKGWSVFGYDREQRAKRLEGPGTLEMGYSRFCNVCGDERKKMKTKITG